MAQQEINIGAAPNDGTGDTLRAAGEKINENFAEVFRPRGIHAPFPLASGEYASAATNVTLLTTLATVANRLVLHPFMPARQLTIDQIGTYVTAGVASAKMRLGVYADNGARYPGALLADSGELEAATNNAAAQAAVALTLEPDTLYWLAHIGSHNPTIRAIAGAAMMPLRSPDGSAAAVDNILFLASTYGALPATGPEGLAAAATVAPFIRLRVA